MNKEPKIHKGLAKNLTRQSGAMSAIPAALLSWLLFCSLVLSTGVYGEEQTNKHRIAGLFSPDREADLRLALQKLPEVRLVHLDFNRGEGTFIYNPTNAFPGVKPSEIVKRFNEKLRSASNHTLGVQPLVAIPPEKLTRIEIAVAGLDCQGCCLVAHESIYKLEGVIQATASFKEGRVTALIDPEKIDRAALETALKQQNVAIKEP